MSIELNLPFFRISKRRGETLVVLHKRTGAVAQGNNPFRLIGELRDGIRLYDDVTKPTSRRSGSAL